MDVQLPSGNILYEEELKKAHEEILNVLVAFDFTLEEAEVVLSTMSEKLRYNAILPNTI